MSTTIRPTQVQLDVVRRAVAQGFEVLPAKKMLILVDEIERLRAEQSHLLTLLLRTVAWLEENVLDNDPDASEPDAETGALYRALLGACYDTNEGLRQGEARS
jgi:hypothetical protein